MDIVNIDTWASSEVKTITLSQIFLDAPYTVQVKKFDPLPGDSLEEEWTSGQQVKKHVLPRYALVDMHATAEVVEDFVDRNIARYIQGAVGDQEDLIWQTYNFAFRYMSKAKVGSHCT